MKRRLLSISLTICMIISLLPMTALAAEDTYADFSGHWAESAIERWSDYDNNGAINMADAPELPTSGNSITGWKDYRATVAFDFATTLTRSYLVATESGGAEPFAPMDIADYLGLLDYDNAASLAQYLSDEIGNRLAGTVRRDMAADWIVDTLESYGYGQNNLGLEIDEFDLTNNSWAKVDILSGFFEVDGKQYIYHGPAYAAETVYKYVDATPKEFAGVAVLNWENVNSALTLPEDVDYTGKAVIVTMGAGPATTGSRSATPAPSAVNYYAAVLALQNANAEAVIFQSHQPRTDGASTSAKIANTTTGTDITIPVGLTLWHETHEVVDALAATSKPVKLSMKDIDYAKNIIATIPSATGSKKSVYITCHYDTTVSTPGMNDNGSGVIFMLEQARAFKEVKFDYNIVFVFFDSEDSNSMCGSRTFAQNYMTEEDKANFVANYNVDMISTAQEDCFHMFLNISDTDLKSLELNLANNDRLIEYPGAVEIAQKYNIFNHNYSAALNLGFDMSKFNICYDTTTDHINFVREATRSGNNYPNMLNAVEYDWRTNEKGTSFELLYHQTGDKYTVNFSKTRLQQIGDMMSLAVYYTAIAEPDYVPVSVDLNVNNGNPLAENSKQLTTNAPYGTLPTPTRNDYIFDGWFTASTDGAKVTPSTPVTNTTNHTLYAQWTQTSEPQETCTVSFDANVGSGSKSPVTVTKGESYALPANPFTRSGYNFSGWKVNNQGDTLDVQTSITVDEDITLYAQWSARSSGTSSSGTSSSASLSTTKSTYDTDGGKDISVTLTLKSKTLKGLKNGSYTLKEGVDYMVSDNTVTITDSYLSTLPVGTQTIVFEMSSGTNPQLTITVSGTAKEEQPTGSVYQTMKPIHSAGTRVEAGKTNNALVLNGKVTEFPAVKVSGYNLLKLRDFAALLKGTSKQFAISYDVATGIIDIRIGQAYQPLGDELTDTLAKVENAVASLQQIRVNGEFLDVAAYNIKGYNYFRLRDLAIILNFAVIYDDASGQITLDFDNPYSE